MLLNVRNLVEERLEEAHNSLNVNGFLQVLLHLQNLGYVNFEFTLLIKLEFRVGLYFFS